MMRLLNHNRGQLPSQPPPPAHAMHKHHADDDLIVDFPKLSRERIVTKPKRMSKRVQFSPTSTLHQWLDLHDEDGKSQSNWYSKREFAAFRKAAKSQAAATRRNSETGFDVERLENGSVFSESTAGSSNRPVSEEGTSSSTRRSSDTVFASQDLECSPTAKAVITRRSSDILSGGPRGLNDSTNKLLDDIPSNNTYSRRRSDTVCGNDEDDSDKYDEESCITGVEHLVCLKTLRQIIDYRALHKEAVLVEQYRQYQCGIRDPKALKAVSKAHSKVGRLRALSLAGGQARKRDRGQGRDPAREKERGPVASAA